MENIPQLQKESAIYYDHWNYEYLPAFAKFIRENYLIEFTKTQLQKCRDVDLPLLKELAHIPEDELLEMSLMGQIDLLQHAEENRLKDRVERTLNDWESNDMKIIDKNQLSLTDLVLTDFVRKQSFSDFIPFYTTDLSLALNILKDIDTYQRMSMQLSSDTYIRILRTEIDRHIHFIERITNTAPGGICIFDIGKQNLKYINDGFQTLLGYPQGALEAMQDQLLQNIVFPEDLPAVVEMLENISNIEKGEVRTTDCRMKTAEGNYIWIRIYMSLFKSTHDSQASELIAFLTNIQEEKIGNQKLVQSQDQLLEAQELANMGSYVLDIAKDSMEVTPQFLSIYEINDISQRPETFKNIHPADYDQVMAARQKAIDNHDMFDIEYRYLVNGKEKIIWARGKVFFQNGKKLMKGTIMDVTEKKHMVQKLQRSEMLHKQAQALAHIGNWTWNLQQQKLDWSDEMYKIHEIDPATELDYERINRSIHPEDLEQVRMVLQNAIVNHTPFDIVYRIITPRDREKVLHVKGQVLVSESNEAYKVLGTMQDVTKEYLINKELEESREFANKIADTTPSLITLFNVSTLQCNFINRSLKSTLGYETSAAMGRGIRFFADLIHPDDIQRINAECEAALQLANNNLPEQENQEELAELKYRMKCSNGEYHWFHTYATVFDRNDDDRVLNVLMISTDISKQVEADLLLSQHNTQLKQSNKNLEEFAFITSHDLKEPLRKIATFGDRLSTIYKDKLGGDGGMYIDKIIHATKRMQTMIDDLIALSILEGKPVFESYDLNNIFQETLSTLEDKIQQKGATVTADKLPVMKVVPSQFRQLFQNLVANALKFSHTDRTPAIHISAYVLSNKEVEQYGLPAYKSHMKISFKDNGIGFEQEYADKIFMTFQRLHGKSEYEGNGIGLSICRKVADNHNGFISALGVPNEGATFSVIIPQD